MVHRATLNLADTVRRAVSSGRESLRLPRASLPHRNRIKKFDDSPNGEYFRDVLEGHGRVHASELLRKPEDILKALNGVDLNLRYFDDGGDISIPAAVNPASKYNNKMWTRDTALIGLMLYELGHTELAVQIAETLAKTYARQEERKRFTDFIFDREPMKKFQSDVKGIPHVMFSIPEGKIHGYNDWSHNQLDAFGMFLLFISRLAKEGKLDLKKLDEKLTRINPDNKKDSTFSIMVQFMDKIQFWENLDVGPWEDEHGLGPESKRLSSNALCLSGFTEAGQCFDEIGWDAINMWDANMVKCLIAKGKEQGEHTLHERVPLDGSYVRETDRHESDAAMVFVLLFAPDLNKNQKTAILRKLYDQRMTDFGFTRRHRDSYMGSNFVHNPYSEGIFSDVFNPDHKMAEWTLFDPLLAIYHCREYQKDPQGNRENLPLAIMHYERFQRMVPQEDFDYVNRFKTENYDNGTKRVFISRGTVGEAYFWDGGQRKLNENSPLQMAVVSAALMKQELAKILKLSARLDHSAGILQAS